MRYFIYNGERKYNILKKDNINVYWENTVSGYKGSMTLASYNVSIKNGTYVESDDFKEYAKEMMNG